MVKRRFPTICPSCGGVLRVESLHCSGTHHGFGVEITSTDTKDTLLYGIWLGGTLKYQYKDKKWVEVN